MKLGIIHLSDIHLTENYSDNPCLEKAKSLINSIKSSLSDADTILCLVTGDLASSGKPTEFQLAKELLALLERDIKSVLKKPYLLLIIPGNHDCFFKPDSVRELVIRQLEESNYSNIDEEIIEVCCKPQANYFSFETEIQSPEWQILHSEKLFKTVELKLGSENVIFSCFNTSWISKKHEDYGKMALPLQIFENPIFDQKANLKINLIHHPVNWQLQSHYRQLKKRLEESADFIFSGHEHVDEFNSHLDETKDSFSGHLEAGVFQDLANPEESRFNLLFIDVTEVKYQLSRFNYDLATKMYKCTAKSELLSYDHRFNLSKNEYILSKSLEKFLNDAGAPFRHPKTESINFDDLYVVPDLRELSIDPLHFSKQNKIISAQGLLSCDSDFRFVIIGSESAGKTAFCKSLFKYSYENNLVPIYIDASEIKDVAKAKFHDFIKAKFLQQYDPKCHNKFDALAYSQFVVIIDNYNSIKIPTKYRQVLISNIKEQYKKLLVTGDSLVHFQPFTIKDGVKMGVFDNFLCFNLMEFGVENRYALITKWNKLGIEFDDDSEEVYRKNDYAEQQIKTVLGNHYIPSYPIYIITLLQSIALSSGNSNYNLYGYYYEYLITEAINKAVINKDYHQFYHQFLSEYSYFLFEEKVKNISKDNFKDFFATFQTKYRTSLVFDSVVSHLISSKLIDLKDEFVFISHSYIYYYYVAKHISNSLSEGYFRDLVQKMVRRVYNEEFASIIIFLSHVSKDPLITAALYTNAQSLFANIPETKLEGDIEVINSLIDELPTITYEDKDVEEARLMEIRSKEEAERIEREYEEVSISENDLDEDTTTIDILNSIVLAVKTFEILGQITKKYWGSTPGVEKLKLTTATYNLALRTLNYYYMLISGSKEYLAECLRIIVDRKRIMDISKVKQETEKLLFQYSFLATYGITKKIVDSSGHKQLSDTYAEMAAKYSSNAYKLIDIAIKLEHYGSFPAQEIKKLKEDPMFKKNFLCQHIVKNMVLQYLHLYRTSIETKQRICDLVEIDIKQQLVIDQTSKEKRK